MMDQLYANQTTTGYPASAIAVSAISTNTPDSSSKNTLPNQTTSFKEQLASPKAKLTAPLDSSASVQKTNGVKTSDDSGQEFGFLDFLDIINPLQHIPVVSSIYREITGDELKPTARIFGGILFGGPSGFVTAIANSIVEETTGKDIGANIFEALLRPGETDDLIQVAESYVPNNQVTASTLKETTEPASTEVPNIFAKLSPVTPSAPTLINSVTSSLGTQSIGVGDQSPSSNNVQNLQLEGKAALAAIYNDLGRIKTNTNQDLASQSLQVAEAATSTNTLENLSAQTNLRGGNPSKWFPLSGNNVIIAQASAPPPRSALPVAPLEQKAPAAEVASINQSEFAKNLLTGLDKYRELKNP